MKKYIALLSLLGVMVMCKNKGVPDKFGFQYSLSYVRNPCTGRWAVRTGITYTYLTYGSSVMDTNYWGIYHYPSIFHDTGVFYPTDSSVRASAGSEFQFGTKDSAVAAYTSWPLNEDRIIRRKQIEDSVYKKEKSVSDSIFKRNHTYN